MGSGNAIGEHFDLIFTSPFKQGKTAKKSIKLGTWNIPKHVVAVVCGRAPGLWGMGSRGVKNAGCGKRGVGWYTRGLVESAGYHFFAMV